MCFAKGDKESQAAVGPCLGDETVPSAYFIQENEKVMLVKGDTDKVRVMLKTFLQIRHYVPQYINDENTRIPGLAHHGDSCKFRLQSGLHCCREQVLGAYG